MAKPEKEGDISVSEVVGQSKSPENGRGFLEKLRGLWTKKEAARTESVVVAELAESVEQGQGTVEQVAESVSDKVEAQEQETVAEIQKEQANLSAEAPKDPAVAELADLAVQERQAAETVQKEIEAEKTETLFERVANHAEDVAGLDEVVARLEQYQNPDQWGNGPDREQLKTAFQNMPENSFCFGSWNNGKQEVFFTDSGKSLKKAEVDTTGDLARSSIGEVKDKLTDALKAEGWRGNGFLGEIARTVVTQKGKEESKKKLEENRDKIAKGEFGDKGIESFFAKAESVADLSALKKLIAEFKPASYSDPDKEELAKGLAYFESLPVGAYQMETSKGNSGVDGFRIMYKAGEGEIKSVNVSVWDMDKQGRDDPELESVVQFSQSARRGSEADDKMMADRMIQVLRDKGFSQTGSLFGTMTGPSGTETNFPLYRVLKK